MNHQNAYEVNHLIELPTSLLPDAPEVPPHDPRMDAVYGVGPDKPLGYLQVEEIYVYGEHPEAVADLSRKRGLSTIMQDEGEGLVRGRGGALFVYDENALASLLAEQVQVLAARGWPIDPSEFARRVSVEMVYPERDPELFKIIAWAYKDPRPEYQRPTPADPTKSDS
jgi:hypothetical protein